MEGYEENLWKKYAISLEEHQKRDKILYHSKLFKIHPVVMHYLFQQGVKETEEIFTFLYPTTSDFHDPFLLNDMKVAVDRIMKAIIKKEKIFIFGDYDGDGITSTALLFKCLQSLGSDVSYKVPSRAEGYGLKTSIIHRLPDNISLIITVDNGTTCHKALADAANRGIDVIVTDHHEISEKGRPNCLAFLNPKRKFNNYPFPHLSGAGVVFKLAHALHLALDRDWSIHYKEYIEFAAIGTISDLVPLKGENRTICKLALEKMNRAPSEVLKTICSLLNIPRVNSSTISNQIAPLLNSQGKLGDPKQSVELLVSENVSADNVIRHIELNEKRKRMSDIQYAMCEELIKENRSFEQPVITVHGNFQKGCIGSLASKISKKYRKPVVIVGENGAGSGRSVCSSRFSLLNTLNRCKEHLIKFGGHHCAVGFCIETSDENIQSFFATIQDAAKKEGISFSFKWYFTEQSPIEFKRGMFGDLQLLEPFGKDFYQPIFLSPALHIKEVKTFGDNGEHAKVITDNKDTFYFYNQSSRVRNYKNQKRNFFYSSTLNDENEFLAHAVEQPINLEHYGIF